MRVAALYDIHGNLPALEAVIAEVRLADVDQVVVGGDVFPGPIPLESLESLLNLGLPVQFIYGNGDREVLAQMKGVETDWYQMASEAFREPIRWNVQQLRPEHAQQLADWPASLRVAIDGLGGVLFCHATPRNDTECFTRLTQEQSCGASLKGSRHRRVTDKRCPSWPLCASWPNRLRALRGYFLRRTNPSGGTTSESE